jgi:hypothetical protein
MLLGMLCALAGSFIEEVRKIFAVALAGEQNVATVLEPLGSLGLKALIASTAILFVTGWFQAGFRIGPPVKADPPTPKEVERSGKILSAAKFVSAVLFRLCLSCLFLVLSLRFALSWNLRSLSIDWVMASALCFALGVLVWQAGVWIRVLLARYLD